MKSTTTNTGQIAILVALIGLFIAIIAFAPMLESTPLATTDKKFRAKAGTERKGVRALVSKTASSTPSEQMHGTRDTPLEGWEAPKSWERLKHAQDGEAANETTYGDVTAEALNTLSPAEGIAHVQAQLMTVQDPGTTAALYAALGRLYAFRDPPDLDAALAAFDRAVELAPSAEARHSIVRDRILAMHDAGRPEEILALVEGAVRPDDEASLATLQLDLLRAAALEKLDRADDAAAVYQTIMDRTLEMRDDNPLQAEDIYRQGAMRLARLYRETGRTEEADAIARDVRHLEETNPFTEAPAPAP